MKACMTNDEKYRSLLDVCDTDIIYEGVWVLLFQNNIK
jgi:hypothetical protein